MRQFIDGYPGQKIETLLANTAKPVRQARRKTNRTEYRVRDTVRTARGEGVIKFVFQCGPNGKTTYSVGFANKRLGIIFHENELAPGSARAPAHLA